MNSAYEDFQVIREFYELGEIDEAEANENIEKLDKLIESLELKSMLSEEEDALSAIVTINAGAGGTESCDWASMLFRMYRRYAERRNWKEELIDYANRSGAPLEVLENLEAIEDDGVVVKDKNGMEYKIASDNVILSVGYNPAPLTTKGVHVIGDAKAVGNLRTVIWGAWDVAMKL